MKKILVFIIMICSIITLSSCKKKVLTKRTMANFLEDFVFAESKTGMADYERYQGFIQNEKNNSNRSDSTSKTTINVTTKKKIVIEKLSYTIYNRSETETIKVASSTLNHDGNKKQTYVNLLEKYSEVEIAPNDEMTFELEYSDFTITKNNMVKFFFGIYPYLAMPDGYYNFLISNSGIYKLNIEYSAYI